MNVSSYIQQIVIGVIIVLAVAFDTFAKSRRRRIWGRPVVVPDRVITGSCPIGLCSRLFFLSQPRWRRPTAIAKAKASPNLRCYASDCS